MSLTCDPSLSKAEHSHRHGSSEAASAKWRVTWNGINPHKWTEGHFRGLQLFFHWSGTGKGQDEPMKTPKHPMPSKVQNQCPRMHLPGCREVFVHFHVVVLFFCTEINCCYHACILGYRDNSQQMFARLISGHRNHVTKTFPTFPVLDQPLRERL